MGPRKTAWDSFIMVVILYSAILVPYRLALSVEPTRTESHMELIVDALFMLDILICFNTAVIDPSTELMVTSRAVIAEEYVKFWLWIDVVSALPYDLILGGFRQDSGGSAGSLRLFKIFRMVRLFKLTRVFKLGRLGKQLERLNINPVYFSALRVVFIFWFVAHILACVWLYIGLHQPSSGQPTWMRDSLGFGDITSYRDTYRYGVAFYWVLATMFSIGYGDFTPRSDLERGFAMILMLSGGVTFGLVVGQVESILDTRNPQARLEKVKMEELKNYLVNKNAPPKLKEEISVSPSDISLPAHPSD
jgi:hypothetical protein